MKIFIDCVAIFPVQLTDFTSHYGNFSDIDIDAMHSAERAREPYLKDTT